MCINLYHIIIYYNFFGKFKLNGNFILIKINNELLREVSVKLYTLEYDEMKKVLGDQKNYIAFTSDILKHKISRIRVKLLLLFFTVFTPFIIISYVGLFYGGYYSHVNIFVHIMHNILLIIASWCGGTLIGGYLATYNTYNNSTELIVDTRDTFFSFHEEFHPLPSLNGYVILGGDVRRRSFTGVTNELWDNMVTNTKLLLLTEHYTLSPRSGHTKTVPVTYNLTDKTCSHMFLPHLKIPTDNSTWCYWYESS